MGNHPVKLDYSSLKKGVEGLQKNHVVMANHQLMQQKISVSQMKIIPMKVQSINETITSQLGRYSFWESYLHAWRFYTLREKKQLKMTQQNTKFSILLVQSFQSAEHLILPSNFTQNVILKLRIVNSCVNLNLCNWCTLTVVNVVSKNDLMLFLENKNDLRKSCILFMYLYVYSYICMKYINQHVQLYLKITYKHNFTPHIAILLKYFLFNKNIFKRIECVSTLELLNHNIVTE